MAWPNGNWRTNPSHLSVRKIIQAIPNDGCLLIFNADHPNWRSRACETGVLRCHAIDDRPYQRIRDLYITWKEDV